MMRPSASKMGFSPNINKSVLVALIWNKSSCVGCAYGIVFVLIVNFIQIGKLFYTGCAPGSHYCDQITVLSGFDHLIQLDQIQRPDDILFPGSNRSCKKQRCNHYCCNNAACTTLIHAGCLICLLSPARWQSIQDRVLY